MSPENANGTFVLGGIPFSVAGPPPTTWSSGRVAAVAAVEVTIAPGVTVTVDVAAPSSVLAWAIDDFAESDALAAACESGTAVATVIDQVRRGESPADAALSLRPAWARKALVVGVSQWMPRAIHEGALILDQAAALEASGDSFSAARLVAVGWPVLQALALDGEDGSLSVAAVAELSAAAELAAAAVERLDWGPQVRDLSDRVRTTLGISDVDFDLIKEQWRDLLPLDVAAGNLSVATDLSGTEAPVSVPVDPAAVTARILRWIDAHTRELTITQTDDGTEVVAELSISLADTVDEGGREIGSISAYAADPDRGVLLSTGRTELDGRMLRCTLRFPLPASGKVGYGVFDADYGTSVLRTTALDNDLIWIDRMLIDAWSRSRAALAMRAQADGAERAADGFLSDAIRLVEDASDRLQMTIRTATLSATDRVESLTARAAAIESYLDFLASGGASTASGELLLAELVPLGFADHWTGPVSTE
jgi:hypothetical protein